MKFWNDFKTFAFKGNVIDLAVGMMIGSAFTTIVNSLVNDVFMPLISTLTKGVNFADLGILISKAAVEGEADVVLKYGSFIQNVINFFLVALCSLPGHLLALACFGIHPGH